MPAINVLAVVVAAVAAFLVSAIWYILWGKELATVSPAFAEGLRKRQPWKLLVVLGQSLVLALVLGYVMGFVRNVDVLRALLIGFLLWVGLSLMQWVGAIMWERQPWKMAAIHAGDWLVKLLLITVIVGLWR